MEPEATDECRTFCFAQKSSVLFVAMDLEQKIFTFALFLVNKQMRWVFLPSTS